MNDSSAIRHFAQSESEEAASAVKILADQGIDATLSESKSDSSTVPTSHSGELVLMVKASEAPRATSILDQAEDRIAIREETTSAESISPPRTRAIAIIGYASLIIGLVVRYMEDLSANVSYTLIGLGVIMIFASAIVSRRKMRSA